MFKVSLLHALFLPVLMFGQASFAGLNLAKVKQCISEEMAVVRVTHPLKAEYLREEREGSVAELISMLKENYADLDTLSDLELAGSHGAALTKEIAQIKEVLESSNSCVTARKAMLKFARDYDKKPLLSLSVFFEPGQDEIKLWNAEAKAALTPANYPKALATIIASEHPALTLLLASGETTSVLDEQFSLGRDETMKSALLAIVGKDASANVLEARLVEKMRKENLLRMGKLLGAAKDLVSK